MLEAAYGRPECSRRRTCGSIESLLTALACSCDGGMCGSPVAASCILPLRPSILPHAPYRRLSCPNPYQPQLPTVSASIPSYLLRYSAAAVCTAAIFHALLAVSPNPGWMEQVD